ncbi:uncharacterized protein N7500_008020 [Penicillium coprophilum]|uniref:uncharacterized protein n=1 Tax=Penicillium coprophilum TaxID=36646 RepID=UPI00239690AC|nr:uncharacterized protein N7500_008020 [Penicillium coprophilum]KAJ5158369.1 hypothetical protein N7500_008020 [Penicillium coprophilum]
MNELGKDQKKETPSSPLPKDLQDLVDKQEEDREIRADYENSWTETSSDQDLSKRLDNASTESENILEKTKDQLLGKGTEKEKQS